MQESLVSLNTFGTQLPCEKLQALLLDTGHLGPICPHYSSHVSDGIQDITAPSGLVADCVE